MTRRRVHKDQHKDFSDELFTKMTKNVYLKSNQVFLVKALGAVNVLRNIYLSVRCLPSKSPDCQRMTFNAKSKSSSVIQRAERFLNLRHFFNCLKWNKTTGEYSRCAHPSLHHNCLYLGSSFSTQTLKCDICWTLFFLFSIESSHLLCSQRALYFPC